MEWKARLLFLCRYNSSAARLACLAAVAFCLVLAVWIVTDSVRLSVTHRVLYLSYLPPAFSGLKIALRADIHRGPFVSQKRVHQIVERTNALRPDLILLAGDYVYLDARYIASVWRELGRLRAPLGVYAVLGNHDHWAGAAFSRAAMQQADIGDLSNRYLCLKRDSQALYVVGVDDSWAGKANLATALRGVPPGALISGLCHNPDFITTPPARAAHIPLWLTGHTHGGQICWPTGRPWRTSSLCGFTSGLRPLPDTLVYTTRGLGVVPPPIHWNCPAELTLIELQPGSPTKNREE